ncbi:MAG: flagellar protein FliS [Anaerocolumna sp.]|jgi:flagellar protein FliS|nr:flagellar protein FliS [Anaerocolumna sp.]
MAINAALAYQNNKVNTATPGELTLMLYEGAIKFCNIAINGINENNITKINQNLLKAERIITHLRSTLDFKYPVAQDFDKIYSYVYDGLVQANIKKDAEKIEEIVGVIREMRDTWKEVIKLTK